MCVGGVGGWVGVYMVFWDVYDLIISKTNGQVKGHKSGLFLCKSKLEQGFMEFPPPHPLPPTAPTISLSLSPPNPSLSPIPLECSATSEDERILMKEAFSGKN